MNGYKYFKLLTLEFTFTFACLSIVETQYITSLLIFNSLHLLRHFDQTPPV
ncbi:MAG: hypothetical protein LBP59_01325 [Planctomycetaceae bacterium]|nr:hypothetical protein [Planctomycetaceae bacterium]